MKKQILNLGKALNKAEQKEINGGTALWCGQCVCVGGMWPIVVHSCGTSQRSACLNACDEM